MIFFIQANLTKIFVSIQLRRSTPSFNSCRFAFFLFSLFFLLLSLSLSFVAVGTGERTAKRPKD